MWQPSSVTAAKFPALGAQNLRYLKLGLIGHPVSHSISPLLHGAALSFAGLAGEYNLIDIVPEEVESRVPELMHVDDGYAGLNVTVPHKQAVFRLVDLLTEEAQKVGAVNTVGIAHGGKLIGHNTDLGGFVSALSSLLPAGYAAQATRAALFGAGGAARAAVWGLIEYGFEDIVVVARDATKASALVCSVMDALPVEFAYVRLSAVAADDAASELADTAVVANCTPVGLKDGAIPSWMEFVLKAGSRTPRYFYDMVYAGRGRTTTPLVHLAKSHGWTAADGLSMLVEQAALSFTFWSGVKIPAHVMARALQA